MRTASDASVAMSATSAPPVHTPVEGFDVFALLTPNLYDDAAPDHPTVEAFRRACREVYGTDRSADLKRLALLLHPDKGGTTQAFAYWQPALVAARHLFDEAVTSLDPTPGAPFDASEISRAKRARTAVQRLERVDFAGVPLAPRLGPPRAQRLDLGYRLDMLEEPEPEPAPAPNNEVSSDDGVEVEPPPPPQPKAKRKPKPKTKRARPPAAAPDPDPPIGVVAAPASEASLELVAEPPDPSTTTASGEKRQRIDSANPRWERNKKPKEETRVDPNLCAVPTEGVEWTQGMLKNLSYSFFEWCDSPQGAGYRNLTWRSNIMPVFNRALFNDKPYEDQIKGRKEYYFYGNLSMLPDRGEHNRWSASGGRQGPQWFSTFWQWVEKHEPHRLPVIRTQEGYVRLTYKVLQEGVDGRHDGRKFTMMLKAFYEYAEVRALGRLRAQGCANPWAALAGDRDFAEHLMSMQGPKPRKASTQAKTSLEAQGSKKKRKRKAAAADAACEQRAA
jgi:hypothetical protein